MIFISKSSRLAFWVWVNKRLQACYAMILKKKIMPLLPKQPPPPAAPSAPPLQAQQVKGDGFLVFYIHPTTGQMVSIGPDPKGYDS